MDELQDLLKELEQTLNDRLHAAGTGALHDVKNFHSVNDFIVLLEESENDFNYCAGEMENIEDYNTDEYQHLAEAAKNRFQREVTNLMDTLDFYNLEEDARLLALKNR